MSKAWGLSSWGIDEWGGAQLLLGSLPSPPIPPVDNPALHPQIVNHSIAPGVAIVSTQAIAFDVIDVTGNFTRIVVACTQADTGIAEVVHNGASFRGKFAASSSRVAIAGGFRYTVLRDGGWTGAPTFEVYAENTQGLENA